LVTVSVSVATGCADGAESDGGGIEVPAPPGFDVPAPVTASTTSGIGSTPTSTAPGTNTTPTPTPTPTEPTGTQAPAPTGEPTAPTQGAAGMAAPTPVQETPDPGAMDPAVPPMSSTDALIPEVTSDCPVFASSTINFGGLGGIRMEAGPKAAGPTAPMVFYWHGTGSTSGEFVGMAGAVHQGVLAEGGVLISFQGTTGGDALSGTSVFGRGDLDLVDQLVACAVRDHNIDPNRIYTTGCSAGGLFSTNMAALRSNYVAAAAPNSGGMTFPQAFQNDYTPALMTIHGAPGVDVVIIDFSDTSATADMTFSDRGGFVINCNHGGRHCGGGGLAPSIWEFFKAHPYGIDASPWTGGLPAGFDSTCEIY
jgi:dienelactone hydrolase